ncbi:MAG TPA: electron transfer flavoprotein subunit alpha, partial [Nitrospirae bacterium]|nr:electron transfer flavoprotein subunit alpha [Nitrospirota bacterium]
MPVIIKTDKCTGCGTCIDSCPFDAIELKDEKAHINEYCNACMSCLEVCEEGAIVEIKDAQKAVAKDFSDYKDVLIFAEQRDGEVAAVSYELIGAARRLAGELGTSVHALLLGADENAAKELIKWGADKVFLCSDSSLLPFNDDSYSEVLTKVIKDNKPAIVLAGATPVGRSFIPRVAAKLKTGLTADCTLLEIDKETKHLLQVRPAFGGNIMATILCPDYRPQMATVRPRVMKKDVYDESRKGEIVNVRLDGITSRTKVTASVKEESALSVNLHEADVIVAGGRGCGGEKGFKL